MSRPCKWDCVWIGNWGDGERANEIDEFLLQPIRELGLRAAVYGVRYPEEARAAMIQAGIEYCGWVPNYLVPEIFASAKLTVHIPRQAYRTILAGIPTIRPFEALACGIPLISAPWRDVEKLFRFGEDLLIANNSGEMMSHIDRLLGDSTMAQRLRDCGLETIRSRHTCSHRVDELIRVADTIKAGSALEFDMGKKI
ncbi:MAG: glycosyltransferase [Verrucomicrobia bacterium]|nr:glycosyltransferase [Verrucomicrobiota bacterium]